jgi:hypothetical protein
VQSCALDTAPVLRVFLKDRSRLPSDIVEFNSIPMRSRYLNWSSCFLRLTVLGMSAALMPSVLRAASCESLAAAKLPNATITAAQTNPAGTFTPPVPKPRLLNGLPEFCRVTAVLRPSSDSNIQAEVWLPSSNWNEKFRAAGNGGFAGAINYNDMAHALRDGYATASTDTGHVADGTDARWALGHPEKVVDFGYRAIHEMTVFAKSIVNEFYSKAPQRSYFTSCSNGGRQALMEAQRYPNDYDGIIAGAPANNWTGLLSYGLANLQSLIVEPGAYIPDRKIPAISSAVLRACDASDGLEDGIVSDPPRCHFKPETLLCNGPDSDSCLTEPQVTSLKKIYSGFASANVGNKSFPGFSPGGEDGDGGWKPWIIGRAPNESAGSAYVRNFFSNIVYSQADWDFKTADVNAARQLAEQKSAPILNSTNPNLAPFQKRGGKLILYHGWSDPAIPAQNTVDYYNSLIAALTLQTTSSFVRLYMVPGMQHCVGGPGPSLFGQWGAALSHDPQHDIQQALAQWVEKGTAPEAIIAIKYAKGLDSSSGVVMSRPLCPYPQAAQYKGSGDTNDAANFTCTVPVR